MTPEQMMGMIRAGHDVEHVLDIKSAEDRRDFRTFMLKEAEASPRAAHALEEWERAMRDLDNGIAHARSTWHSISIEQRRVMTACAQYAGRIFRSVGQGGALSNRYHGCGLIPGALLSTVRNLCSGELMAWDGGAFASETAAVITERGRFVVAHGKSPEAC